jgi:hypothetical protein
MGYEQYYESPQSTGYQSRQFDQLKHSGLGIVSFILSVIAVFALVFVLIKAVAIASTHPEGINENSEEVIQLGLLIIGMSFIELLALVLGIVALFLPDRKKVFAILGTVISAVVLLFVIGLIILGST